MSASNSSYNSCSIIYNYLYNEHGLSLVGLCLAILMSFMERRRSFHRKTCFGRPGALVPINLINGDQSVLAHAAAFGCVVMNISVSFAESFTGLDTSNTSPWLETFEGFAKMMDFGLQYYPIFVCVEYGSKNIVAPIVGLLYALTLLAINISVVVLCNKVYLLLPVLCCLSFLCIKFARNFYTKIRNLLKADFPNSDAFTVTGSRCRRYAKYLFIYNKTDNEVLKWDKNKIAMFLSKQKTCFQNELVHRCSNRMLSIFFLLGLLVYQWLVVSIEVAVDYQQQYKEVENGQYTNILFWVLGKKHSLTFLRVTIGSYYTGAFVATLVMIINMWKLYSSHRKHIRMLLAGNKDFIPQKCWNMEPHTIVARNIMYPGMQIGFFLWGFLLNLTTVVVLCFLLSYFLILPLIDQELDSLLKPIRIMLPPMVTTILFRIAFFLFTNVFLQEKVVEEANGNVTTRKVLALNNWRAYHNVSYFMFFFYIILGVFACFRKIIISIAVGFYYLARLDKCTLIPGLEHLDYGYLAYVSFLRMELSHCNPVMITFCDLLNGALQQHTNIREFSSLSDIHREMTTPSAKRNRARKRWFKFYTLQRNPDLIPLTKYMINRNKNSEGQGTADVQNSHNSIYENV